MPDMHKARSAIETDCPSLAVLATRVWLDTYAADGIRPAYANYVLETFTPEYFSKLLAADNYQLLVFVEDDCLKGFAVINLSSHYQSSDNGFEIEKLYVDKQFQGQGIGKALLERITELYGSPYWLYTRATQKCTKSGLSQRFQYKAHS